MASRSSNRVLPLESLAELLELVDDGTISGTMAKAVFDSMYETGKAAAEIVQAMGLRQISDENALVTAIEQVLANNPKEVSEFRAGREKLLSFFMGQVMKATQGKVNPQAVNKLLREKLAERKHENSAPDCTRLSSRNIFHRLAVPSCASLPHTCDIASLAYRPLNVGLRFSRKARLASCASSDPLRIPPAFEVITIVVSMELSRAARMMRLLIHCTMGGVRA